MQKLHHKCKLYIAGVLDVMYSLAAVTLAGILARDPALVLATHWYRPSVLLERDRM